MRLGDRLKPLVVLIAGFLGVVAVTAALGFTFASPAASSAEDELNDSATTVATTAATNGDGVVEGGVLTILGDREGVIALGTSHPANDNLGTIEVSGEGGRISFVPGEAGVVVNHLVFAELDFFVAPDECSVSVGDVNPRLGVAATTVDCPALTDIRNQGTVRVTGTLGLPADIVGADRGDLPPKGGTISVSGATSLTVSFGVSDPIAWTAFEHPRDNSGTPPQEITLAPHTLEPGAHGGQATITTGDGVVLTPGEEEDDLWVTTLLIEDESYHVKAGQCTVEAIQVGVVSPTATLQHLRWSCHDLEVDELGTVSLEGDVTLARYVIRFR